MTAVKRTSAVTLASLANAAGGMVECAFGSETEISSIEYDSRAVRSGGLFVAIRGFASDGHEHVASAVACGASAVLVERGRASEFSSLAERGIGILVADDVRAALSRLSAAFYGFPSRSMTVIGITGTNGKTSITYMLESILGLCGYRPGVIGTVNYRWGGRVLPAPHTTPESRDLQEMLVRMKSDGVDAVVMEVSSHALELRRADDIDFDAAVFTNLTRDHLDFHQDFDHYFSAKKRIFDILNASVKKGRFGAVNADDPYGRDILLMKQSYAYPVFSFGMADDADYAPDPSSLANTLAGLRYRLARPESGIEVALRLPGSFQLYNSLAAIAVAHRLGIPFADIMAGLGALASVPGRFDVITSDKGFAVIVDYAHTVDALEKLLRSVRELSPKRLITVFGCGGDRDKTKRPLMGKAAEDLSDIVIVTSDNPRTEDPDRIIRDILAGMKGKNHQVIPDREEAIAAAIQKASEGDIVVIAGKGHEDYQIVGTKKIHFDDREVAARLLRG